MTLVDIEAPQDRLTRRRQQLAALKAQREGVERELGQLDVDFTAAVDRGDFTPDQSAERRRLLDEQRDIDAASKTVQGHIAAAEKEIARADARAELEAVRAAIAEEGPAAQQRAEALAGQLARLVNVLVGAAQSAVEKVAGADRDDLRLSNLLAAERQLSIRFGETPMQDPVRGVTWSAGQPTYDPPVFDTGVRSRVDTADAKILAAARRSVADTLTELAEAARHRIPRDPRTPHS